MGVDGLALSSNGSAHPEGLFTGLVSPEFFALGCLPA
jgi:hypothetical protein